MVTKSARAGIALFLLTALAACGGGGGGGNEINPPPPPPPVRAPQQLAFSAGDGVSTNGTTEMYVIEDDGTGQLRLSEDSSFARTLIHDFAVSPDGRSVAYVMDVSNFGETALFVNAINGGTPVRVSRVPPAFGGAVDSFQWSPDSSKLVYAGNMDNSGIFAQFASEVFVVNRDGSGDTKINGAIGIEPSVEVRNPQWSPDGRFVVQEVATFSGQQGAANPFALNIWDSTISTPNSRRLVNSVSVLRNVHWSADSTRISYTADQEQQGTYRVYAIGADGTGNVRAADQGDFNSDSRWSPSGARLAYLDHPNAPFPADLVVSAAAPGATDTVLVFLSPNDRQVYGFEWSPDGSRIAYTSDEETENIRELYVINADGSGPATKVSGPQLSTSDVFEFAWSPDGNSIAYVADADVNGVIDLYVSSVNGSRTTWISTGLNGEEVVDFAWSDDSERLTFSTGPEDRNPQPDKLYVSQPDGSGRTEITDPTTSSPLRFKYD
jgi:Tol biopolymer transport system component